MILSVGNSRMDKRWKSRDLSWEEFKNIVRTTRRTTETVEEYRRMKKAGQDAVKDVGGFVGGALREGRRKNGFVLSRSLLTLDMDYATPGVWENVISLRPWTCCAYSTHKHTPDAARLRLIIPLSREVSEDEYPALGRMVAKEIGLDLFDDTTYEPARLMYWPSAPVNAEFVFHEKDGPFLDPDEYLSRYRDWRDVSSWPVSSRQSEVVRHTLSQQADPLAKEGIVGAFCRAYSVQEAIDAFLSDVYEPNAMDGRYDYIPADSTAGVVLYDDKFAYSHHATDPACGRLLNAFDLVRFHRFRGLDDKCAEGVLPANLPSFRAMRDFVVQDERVKALLAEERLSEANADFSADAPDDWQSKLELDKQGKVKDTATNLAAIVRCGKSLQGIVLNQLKGMLDVIGELPWTQVKPGWGDADLANAKLYIERAYGIWSPVKLKDALLGVVSTYRQYNPVRDYLDSLAWDGTPRLDTLLVDYIGAEDTPYVRAVTRKTLCAAVARIYEPGVKFDSVLVLNGPQGIGKSMLYARLGRQWFSDSLSVIDMKDKSAAEKLQGYWILEVSELNGIRKVEVETVKSFVTRVDDKYRQAYGVNVESHPRASIIVGTSNSDTGFLRDITGNRRFWPVRVTGHGAYYPWQLDPATVDQFWAEAKLRYEEGEELYLTGELALEARDAQRDAMEADDRDGLVAEYLDTLLPEDWPSMDLYARRSFLYGGEFGSSNRKGTVRRERVCPMEIWCECFGKSREALKRSDSGDITGILYRIGGWKRYDGSSTHKLKFGDYGNQQAYLRVSDERERT